MSLRRCCCCIPIRGGVIIISLFTIIFYALCTAGLFIEKNNFDSAAASANVQIGSIDGVFWGAIAVSLLYVVSALFGLVGAVGQHRSLVNVFRFVYWFMATLICIVWLASWIFLLVNKDKVTGQCSSLAQEYGSELSSAGVDPSSLSKDCADSTRTIVIVTGVLFFVVCAFQFYFATVISSYAKRLANGKHEELRNMADMYPGEDTKHPDYY